MTPTVPFALTQIFISSGFLLRLGSGFNTTMPFQILTLPFIRHWWILPFLNNKTSLTSSPNWSNQNFSVAVIAFAVRTLVHRRYVCMYVHRWMQAYMQQHKHRKLYLYLYELFNAYAYTYYTKRTCAYASGHTPSIWLTSSYTSQGLLLVQSLVLRVWKCADMLRHLEREPIWVFSQHIPITCVRHTLRLVLGINNYAYTPWTATNTNIFATHALHACVPYTSMCFGYEKSADCTDLQWQTYKTTCVHTYVYTVRVKNNLSYS